MDKLISAEKFIESIKEIAGVRKFEYHELHFSTNDVLNNIDIQPAVDAIPVSWLLQNGLRRATASEREAIVKLLNEYQRECKKG